MAVVCGESREGGMATGGPVRACTQVQPRCCLCAARRPTRSLKTCNAVSNPGLMLLLACCLTTPPPPPPQAVRPLVITSKTRADVILSLTAAHVCGTGPHIAGLLLTDSTAAFG